MIVLPTQSSEDEGFNTSSFTSIFRLSNLSFWLFRPRVAGDGARYRLGAIIVGLIFITMGALALIGYIEIQE